MNKMGKILCIRPGAIKGQRENNVFPDRQFRHQIVSLKDKSDLSASEYRTLLAQHESIRQSMGRTHCCFDNARMESFFATLKKELIYRLHCASMKREQVRQLIFRWIETYYNRLRRNTANEDNLPPLVKRLRWTQKRSQVA